MAGTSPPSRTFETRKVFAVQLIRNQALMPHAKSSKVATPFADMLISSRRGPPVSSEGMVVTAALGCIAAGLFGALSQRRRGERSVASREPVADCAESLKDGAVLLAGSVLLDSAFEHFRGNYRNRAMYLAPVTAAASAAVSLNRKTPRPVRTTVAATAGGVGVTGLAFHLYNILKRPGGLSWNNLFYAAPAIAPGALALSGFLGYTASHLENALEKTGSERTRREIAPALGLLTAGGILATVAEAALLHFRGSYHNPLMALPVTVPPAAAATLAVASLNPTENTVRASRLALGATAIVGVLGSALHVFGVHRNMGGWRNWRQNLFVGPPIPAPPSFTGLAIGGLGILRLLKQQEKGRARR